MVSEVRCSLCSQSARKQGLLGDIWHVDELFIKIRGQQLYLWHAVDQDGDVIDILVSKRRDRRAATRFFRKMLQHQRQPPWQLITDKLRSYGRHIGRPFLPLCIAPVNTRTTGLKPRISQRVSKNAK